MSDKDRKNVAGTFDAIKKLSVRMSAIECAVKKIENRQAQGSIDAIAPTTTASFELAYVERFLKLKSYMEEGENIFEVIVSMVSIIEELRKSK